MVKQEAIEIINTLPDTATWDDIVYHLSVRQKVEKGLQEAREGKGIPIKEARKQFGL